VIYRVSLAKYHLSIFYKFLLRILGGAKNKYCPWFRLNVAGRMTKLYIVTDSDPEPAINWIILKCKKCPTTQTEIVMKLNNKSRHLFISKIGEPEEEITHLFNVYDKRIFDNVMWKLKIKAL
jgi:hypothetical protein